VKIPAQVRKLVRVKIASKVRLPATIKISNQIRKHIEAKIVAKVRSI